MALGSHPQSTTPRAPLKFKLAPGDDLGLDFVDRELKTVHSLSLNNLPTRRTLGLRAAWLPVVLVRGVSFRGGLIVAR